MSTKWERREAKRRKQRYGMVVSNRNLKSVILVVIGEKATTKKGKKS